jgi:UDP-N-acetylglucosamine 2-epimerase (non-hydrolysing)
MDKIFFEELNLPLPAHNLDIGSGSHAVQTAQMLSGIGLLLEEEKPNLVLVEGDTNTVLAGALAAVKLSIPVGHVEAGLRSHDRRMPEEINRILTDHMSVLLFAPTDIAVRNLIDEGIGSEPFLATNGPRKASIHNVGNSIVDATLQNIELAREMEAGLLEQIGLKPGQYALLTSHRSENVDDNEFLRNLCRLLEHVEEAHGLKVVWPVHPRTVKKLAEFGLEPRARLIRPQGYLEFLALESNARVVITDSGGVQEETCVLGIPCVTVRKTTDRPETVLVGANALGGTELETMREAFDGMMEGRGSWSIPYVRNTSASIVKIVRETMDEMVNPSESPIATEFETRSIGVAHAIS